MLNMQNVKDIEITEGDVRTIHDKDNRLIWGRLAYDTKYAGDTYQQTYSGKNLFNVNGDFNYGNTNHKTISNGDGTLTSTANFSLSRSSGQKIEGLVADTTYTLTATVDSYTGTGKPNAGIIQILNSSSGSVIVIKTISFAVASGIPNTISGSFTTPSDVSAIWISFIGDTTIGSGVAASVTFSRIQLELGSTATTYEPYTGSIPAPNPDYPQAVQVVTGEQTVTISDGANAEDFTINLGSLELRKIGNYQDYIYKSGDDWYVHKETNFKQFNGSESWNFQTSGSASRIASYDTTDGGTGSSAEPGAISNIAISRYSTTNGSVLLSGTYTGRVLFFVPSADFPDQTTWTNFVTTNRPYVYYALATPTDTKITDATLVGQLNAVHEWLTRYGYNATVSGNLPIIINQTNL